MANSKLISATLKLTYNQLLQLNYRSLYLLDLCKKLNAFLKLRILYRKICMVLQKFIVYLKCSLFKP